MDPELQKYLKNLVKVSILVMTLVAVYLLFTYVFPILGKILSYLPILFMPFILAVLLAVIIEPVVNLCEKHLHFKRVWSVLLSLIVVFGSVILILSLIVSVIIREMSSLYRLVLNQSDQIISQLMGFISDFKLLYLRMDLSEQVEAAIQSNLEKAIELIQGWMDNVLDALLQFATSLPGLFVFLLIATVATFFIIRDRAILRTFILQGLPSSTRSKSQHVITELIQALIGFLKAYSILISITAIITFVGLLILRVKYVLVLGIVVGLMDILPVLGPGTIFIPWIIWEFISGNTSMGISLLVLYIIISTLRQFLEPKIVGDNIGLHPLATLISLYVGLQLGGLTGMVLGPVMVVIFIAVYRAGLLDKFDWRKRR